MSASQHTVQEGYLYLRGKSTLLHFDFQQFYLNLTECHMTLAINFLAPIHLGIAILFVSHLQIKGKVKPKIIVIIKPVLN